MQRFFKFLNDFYAKHYGNDNTDSSVARVGAFKMIGLGVSTIFLAGVFQIGSNLDLEGVLLNLGISHILVMAAGFIVNFYSPKTFFNRTDLELFTGFLAPLFIVSFIFGGFYKKGKDVKKNIN